MIPASKDMNRVALLGAFCLFLSTIEFMIPKPIPFMRLGLANLPILVGLSILSPREVLALVLVKILGQGLVNGTLFSYIFLFSAVGSLASGLVMLACRPWLGRLISYLGISILGALASNLTQLLFSRYTVFGENAWIIGPPFLAVGTFTAVLLGLFAQKFTPASQWISRERIRNEETQ